MKAVTWLLACLSICLCISVCSHTKTIFLVNYRNDSYTVETNESRGAANTVAARAGVTLTCDEYVGGSITLYLTNSKGIKETLVIDSATMKSMTVRDSVVIVEVR